MSLNIRFFARRSKLNLPVCIHRRNRKVEMSSGANSKYIGTSDRGLTKEFTFKVPWGHVAGKTWGDEGKPPILCMHGWLDNCNTFDKLIPLLPKDYYYIAFDTPGHGLSSPIAPGMWYFTQMYCGVIRRLLNEFQIQKLTVLGHSMGGNIGTHFGGLYPDIVNRVIVLDSMGVWFKSKRDVVKSLRQSLDSYLAWEKPEQRQQKTYTYEQAKERLQAANSDLTKEAVEILLERGAEMREDGTCIFRRDLRHLYKDCNERDLTNALAIVENINADVLFIWAKEGMPLKFKPAYEKEFQIISDAFNKQKSFQLIEVEGKHHVHLCSPQETAKHITDFLRRTEGSEVAKEDSQSNL